MRNVKGTLSVLAITALAYTALAAQGAPAPAAPAAPPAAIPLSPAQGGALPDYQGAEAQNFLLKAKIGKVQDIPLGVASPRKVQLELNGKAHQAVFKSIDITRPGFQQFEGASTGGEGDFRDSWTAEVAAYQIDLIIGLGKVPATVERYVKNEQGSLQWWVDSMMMESDRLKKGQQAPDTELFSRETLTMRLFDNLIYNTDRNMANILIYHDWTFRLIDHSRSFKVFNTLKTPKELTRFSKSLLAGFKKLEKADLQKKIGKYANGIQINALLARRDAILKLAADTVAEKGEAAALYP